MTRTLGSLATLVALALAGPACNNGEDPSPKTGGTGAGTCDATNGRVTITDDTNYGLLSSIAVKTYTIKDGTDLTFDWGSVTKDFYGKTLDPKIDIDLVLISLWKKTPSQLESALSSDQLLPNTNVGVITTYPTDNSYTSAKLLEFNLLGNPVPPEELTQYFDTTNARFMYPPDQYTFLMEASTGTVPGKGARMLAFFSLDPNTAGTTVSMENDSTVLDYAAHLVGARPMRIPVETPALTIDWSQMLTNALGNEYDGTQINQAVVAHYADKTLSELEDDFLNLESLADGWWSAEVKAGKSVSLAGLTDANDAPFPGIDGTGVWLAALFCTQNCNNPAPWSITVLEPCE